MMHERWMEITFKAGRKMRFQFPEQATDESMMDYISEVLKLPTVTVSADGVLYVMPTTSIEMVTVSPAPKKLPPTVIRGAKLIP
jgi:hypothetical protein